MPISFLCASCGKTANLSEKFAGKKVKCKCGTVGLVPQPDAADDDLLSMDLGAVQYEQVERKKPKRKLTEAQEKAKQKLSRREREDKALAESLGEDWKKGPKSEYRQSSDDDQHWIWDAWDVISSGPVQAFYGYLLGSVMLIFGLQMMIWLGETIAEADSVRVTRRRGRLIFGIPLFFLTFGVFTTIAGAIMFIKGLCDEEKRAELSTTSISLMLVVAVIMFLITAGSIFWLFAF